MVCKYCHAPYKIFENGDKLMPPIYTGDWWGIMPRYQKGRIGTIIKIDYCPACGRKLEGKP